MLYDEALMLVLRTVGALVHSKGVEWGCGEGSVQAHSSSSTSTMVKHAFTELASCTGAL